MDFFKKKVAKCITKVNGWGRGVVEENSQREGQNNKQTETASTQVVLSKHSNCLRVNWFWNFNRIVTFALQLLTSFIIIWVNLLNTFENSIWIITSRSNYFISSPPTPALSLLPLKGEKQTVLNQKVKKQTTFSPNWSVLWTREITLLFKCKSAGCLYCAFPVSSL